MQIDPVALAQALVRLDTTNPPGRETQAADLLATLLEGHGFAVARHDFAPGRTSLVARSPGTDPLAPALAFTGHLDTVPLGQRPWRDDPLGGTIREGRLRGRGACDMKAGVAAVVAAAVEAAGDGARAPLVLILTAGEETGCQGALHLARSGAIGRASALVVAEPTSNRLVTAHKGAFHLRARTAGRTAHGSMPALGSNAVIRAIRAIAAAEAFTFDEAPHPLLGGPTLAVTTVHGGENVNSIPDACAFTLDIRTVPGMEHAAILARLRAALGADVAFDPALVDLPPVGTEPDDAFVALVAALLTRREGAAAAVPAGMPYFTDGSALQPGFGGCPTVMVGPGDPAEAHQTDESCAVAEITAAAELYVDIARAWG